MDVDEQQNSATTSRDGETSRTNRMKGITKRRIEPCPGCSVPGCTLRVGCLLIGVIEIVVWVMVLVVVATLLSAVDDALQKNDDPARSSAPLQAKSNVPHSSVEKIVIKSLRKNSPGTRIVKPDYTRDDDHIDSFIIVGAMFVAASITAGLTLILGVLYRAGILCLIHSGFALFIVALLLFLVVLEIIAGSFYTLVSSIFLIIPYAYFGLCSYALYLQIQRGIDLSKPLKRASVGIEKQRQPATRISIPSNSKAAGNTDAIQEEEA